MHLKHLAWFAKDISVCACICVYTVSSLCPNAFHTIVKEIQQAWENFKILAY